MEIKRNYDCLLLFFFSLSYFHTKCDCARVVISRQWLSNWAMTFVRLFGFVPLLLLWPLTMMTTKIMSKSSKRRDILLFCCSVFLLFLPLRQQLLRSQAICVFFLCLLILVVVFASLIYFTFFRYDSLVRLPLLFWNESFFFSFDIIACRFLPEKKTTKDGKKSQKNTIHG